MDDQPYLSTKDLAHRYGICIATVKRWRTTTRRGEPTGPKWYEVPRLAMERKANTPQRGSRINNERRGPFKV